MSAGGVLIGAGRVASVFARAGLPQLRRGEAIVGPAPVIVCTQAGALPEVLAAVPAALRGDCVIVQNGAWEPLVAGLPAVTRGILWFAAPGGGKATTNRPSLFVGPHAETMVALCTAVDLPAKVIPADAWPAAWAEKMLWNAIFGLLGERDGCTVGASAAKVREVRAFVDELAPAFGLGLHPGPITGRLLRYSEAIGDFSARLREVELRNGWIIHAARSRGVSTPLHDAVMKGLGRPTTPEGVY